MNRLLLLDTLTLCRLMFFQSLRQYNFRILSVSLSQIPKYFTIVVMVFLLSFFFPGKASPSPAAFCDLFFGLSAGINTMETQCGGLLKCSDYKQFISADKANLVFVSIVSLLS